MKSVVMLALVSLALAACGNRGELNPKMGETLPVKPVFATKTPSVAKLLQPDPQARPARSNEQLDRSQQRRDDKFDLPPSNN